MSTLEFLNRLENTLNGLMVKGRDNITRMTAIYQAIDSHREVVEQNGGHADFKPSDDNDNT